MADQTLQEIRTANPATALDGTELLYLLQGGDDAGAIVSQLLTYISGAIGTAAFRTLLDDVSVAAMLATLGGAPLASPALTGNPTAPTPSPGDNDTSIATTAFVAAAVTSGAIADGDKGDVTVSSSGTVWTVDDLPESRITGLVSDLASKAPLVSPTLTGTPAAPTAGVGTNTTQIATTAFVLANGDKLGLTPTALKTSNYTASAGDFVPCDTSGGAFAVTFPTAPADKSVIAIKLTTAGNTLTLTLGGSDVFNKAGGSTSGSLTLTNQGIVCLYSGGIWYVVADDLSISSLDARYQPLDSDLTAIAALTTTAFGRAVLALADAAALRTAAALGTAATADTGTGAANVPTITQADARYQPLDADLTTIAGLTATTDNFLVAVASAWASRTPTQVRTTLGLGTAALVDTGTGASNVPTRTQADTLYQPLDSDLTAIAALSTTSYGRALLALADAAALQTAAGLVIGTNVQAFDAELAALAGLTSAANKGIQFTGSGTAATYDLTTAGKAILDDADAAAQRATLSAAPVAAKYIVQTADSELSAEQALGALATGILKNTTTTGVLSIGTSGTDYGAPIPEGRYTLSGTPNWSIPGVIPVASPATKAAAQDFILYTPFPVVTPITIDRMAIEVTSAAAAGKVARVAIYNCGTDLQPTTLVIDSGDLAVDSTGVKTATVNVSLPAGRYLFAINSNAAPTLRYILGGYGQMSIGYLPALGATPLISRMAVGSTFAAFQSTGVAYTTQTNVSAPGAEYYCFLRVSTP